MKQGWLTDSFIKKGYREIKARISGKYVESATVSSPFGFESNPSKNYIALIAKTEVNGDEVIVGFLNPRALDSLNIGDSMQYATDENGNRVATLILKNDGTAEILGADDNAVRYSKLEEGFNQLKDDLNSFISTFNSHVHICASAGSPSATTTTPGTNSQADISEAKIDTIKVP